MSQVKQIDFREARRLVDARTETPAEVRQRAFACWVSLFDFTDNGLQIEVPARELAESLGVSRVTWIHYRAVLERAGVLKIVTGSRGPHPQLLQLTPPYIR